MLPYRHTQTGKLLIGLVAIPIAILLSVSVFLEVTTVTLALLGVMAAVLLLFSTLTVEVGREAILLWFGPGLIRVRFPLSEVRAVRL
ncbi:MAG: hypothetical protein FJY75_09600, partial [Candidatus Eisenbacteria bacterium]|nr:hypothetical protein [Candidatus Eisenbacteria bacterium]